MVYTCISGLGYGFRLRLSTYCSVLQFFVLVRNVFCMRRMTKGKVEYFRLSPVVVGFGYVGKPLWIVHKFFKLPVQTQVSFFMGDLGESLICSFTHLPRADTDWPRWVLPYSVSHLGEGGWRKQLCIHSSFSLRTYCYLSQIKTKYSCGISLRVPKEANKVFSFSIMCV